LKKPISGGSIFGGAFSGGVVLEGGVNRNQKPHTTNRQPPTANRQIVLLEGNINKDWRMNAGRLL
jgi:hypothetical protein